MAEKKPVYMFEANELFEFDGAVWRKKLSKIHAGLAINIETGEERKIPTMTLVAPYVEVKKKKESFPVRKLPVDPPKTEEQKVETDVDNQLDEL